MQTIAGYDLIIRPQIRDVSNAYSTKTRRYESRRIESGTVDDRQLREAGKNGDGSRAGKTLVSRWGCEKPHLFESDGTLNLEWVDLNWDEFR